MKQNPSILSRSVGFLALLLAATSAVGQSISTVSPTSAAQGASALVSFTLVAGANPVPPAGVPPTSVTLGTITGTSVTHDSQYIVTARFNIPALEAVGGKAAAVVFSPPEGGSLTYAKATAFQVTAGSGVAASFTGTPTSGKAPLTVAFTNVSIGTITNRLWDFGDNTTSIEIHPSHTYTNTGSYTVRLTVFGTNGSNQLIRSSYISVTATNAATNTLAYPIVATGQVNCYNTTNQTTAPAVGQPFYGQDAQFRNTPFSFTDNGDGTITDYNTGLTWQQTPSSSKVSWSQAKSYCDSLELGNQSDWRMPTLKELYSISDFSQGWPYLNTTYFKISAATVSKDEQYWADNYYVGVTAEGGSNAAFGVNHGTGHIKAYPAAITGPMAKLVRAVRGNSYGVNHYVGNGDGTITDQATGLMWPQADSGQGMDWEHALAWAQTLNASNYLGHSDWRLPNAKELQSIVDYTRAPNATNAANVGPAINPLFSCTGITNEAGTADYPYYWTSTSALFQSGGPYYYAWYVAFGMAVNGEGLDFHGAGAVRFDTKVEGGPAGEGGERYYNYVRLVRTVTAPPNTSTFAVVDTGQTQCYSDAIQITAPAAGQPFYGQDAQIAGNQPSYTLGSDGLTVYDNHTGLTWQRSPDTSGDGSITASDKLSWANAQARPAVLNAANYGGYSDWRLSTIKELYSLMNFSGTDPSGFTGTDTSALTPFIDTNYFKFAYGQTSAGERIIDSQYASSTLYVSTASVTLLFGLNLADGRIKGYGLTLHGADKTFFVQCVRGNLNYGINQFVDNGNQTITDQATALMWSKTDSGTGLNWSNALAWVQAKNAEKYLGYNDWHLPNAKELQSIVDYTRSPDTTASAAIDPVFNCTTITNEAGQTDYPWYWSGTTHAAYNGMGAWGAYVCFGRSLGYQNGVWSDVHGAGCQRSDPKGGILTDYTYAAPNGYYHSIAPQGDSIRIYNYVRLVRTPLATDDSVGDGIPNTWRAQYFGGTGATTNATSCAAGDPDHDGTPNYNEYIADTNPTNALSWFHIESIVSEPNLAVSFTSSASRVYTLYYRTNLTSGSWTSIPTQTDVTGNGGMSTLSDPSATDTERFYRLGVKVP